MTLTQPSTQPIAAYLTDLRSQLAPITLEAKATRANADGKCLLTVTLHNPGTQVALMAHLQLRRKQSGDRVLPVFHSDNYVSLVPNESKTISIEAAEADLKGDSPLVVVDAHLYGAACGFAVGAALSWRAAIIQRRSA